MVSFNDFCGISALRGFFTLPNSCSPLHVPTIRRARSRGTDCPLSGFVAMSIR